MENLKGELVAFETRDHILLHGFLIRSKTKSDKVVINVHGLEGTFYRSSYAKILSKKLSENGFNYLSIEQRGSYTAVGFRKMTKKLSYVTAGGGFEVFEDCAYDIEAAVKFLKSLGMKKIFLEGHSTGCQKVAYYQYKKKDKSIKGIILAAPCDDYNIQRTKLGKKFDSTVKLAKALYKKDKLAQMPHWYVKRSFGAGRFLSFSDLKNVESRLFNYESAKLKEFAAVKEPILAIFGTKDQHILRPAIEYMKILERDTGSKKFDYRLIKDADHGFDRKEKQVVAIMIDWLNSIG